MSEPQHVWLVMSPGNNPYAPPIVRGVFADADDAHAAASDHGPLAEVAGWQVIDHESAAMARDTEATK